MYFALWLSVRLQLISKAALERKWDYVSVIVLSISLVETCIWRITKVAFTETLMLHNQFTGICRRSESDFELKMAFAGSGAQSVSGDAGGCSFKSEWLLHMLTRGVALAACSDAWSVRTDTVGLTCLLELHFWRGIRNLQKW